MLCLLARQSITLVLLALLLTGLVGCNSGSEGPNQPRETNSSDEPAEDKSVKTEYTGPAATVHAFLEGARRGDDEAVEAMLTPTARRELAEIGLKAAPRASDMVRFSIGDSQFSPEDKDVAYVSCMRIEVDPTDEQSKNDKIIWALRKVSEGWRIAGMAMTVFEGEPAWAFNFESGEEMAAQGEKLLAEKQRRASAIEGSEETAHAVGGESVAR